MRRQLQIEPHLALVATAGFALAGATAYSLLLIPRRVYTDDPAWIPAAASWATAMAAQCGVFLGIASSVAVHALSGRWSWSVRIFVAISAYWSLNMTMLAINSYQDLERGSGLYRSLSALFQGAVTLAAIFLFYLLFAGLSLCWVSMRGRRFRIVGGKQKKKQIEIPDPI